ncbi:MAG: bifunctional (p)ppGpp synthetase/guanosine-3',5'-bis(diphosphate) 3'-pyrophosphohydrolase [Flavobacteriaceae bacterium]|nr:bifunctional (p)ppGpp synthetase/guanosine-3',5'-bis(diphosphate) 3'-pyrophosphohydrolase [Flavobacteriaceae bacterium]
MPNASKGEEEKEEILKRYRQLLKACKPAMQDGDKKLIRKAFDMALGAHKNMRRKSGEPYIYHPLAVAQICAGEIALGTTSIMCALLHDVVEDTDITLENISLKFGEKVARIIDGLTKIEASVFDSKTGSVQAENFRKMLLTLSDDVRVIIIKLADRLHNMRTLDSMARQSQLKIASETLYIYAPLAHRLGLYAIKTELEDLSIKYTESKEYRFIASKLADTKLERNKFVKNFVEPIKKRLENAELSFEIKGRPKSIFSIMKKMSKQNIPFEEVYDLFAIRIIVDTPPEKEKEDCFKAYSIVTDMYTPNPDRFRDWISTPKANGYESLHTTVMSTEGKWVEVQIRSERMDEVAEKGYAAHWKYKDQKKVKMDDKADYKSISKSQEDRARQDPASGLEDWLNRVREMLENPDSNALDFLDNFKQELQVEEVFVFTPKGDLKKLPTGSTTLDFAYDVHSDVGNKCIGAKVNNKLVPLSHVLVNGDQIEILTSTRQKPNEDWIEFVVTGKAKSKIREYFKEEKRKVAGDGKEMLERKFRNSKIEMKPENLDILLDYFNLPTVTDLYYLVAKGIIEKSSLHLQEIFDYEKKKELDTRHKVAEHHKARAERPQPSRPDAVFIGDNATETDLLYSLAKCCNPIPGDDIFAFVTIGEGIKIHRTNCPNGTDLMANYGYRVQKARWASSDPTKERAFLVGIQIIGTDAIGIVRGITDVISQKLQVNMKSISIDTVDGRFEGGIELYIYDTSHLEDLMEKIKKVEGVYSVDRRS